MKVENIKGWVARDKCNDLYLFNYEPHRTDGIFYPSGSDNVYCLPHDIFPEISWENGPIEVDVSLKKSHHSPIIPFDIRYRDKIESGKYKVVTGKFLPVRIVCWDMSCELPILALVSVNDGKEEVAVGFTNEGTNLLWEENYNKLLIMTEESQSDDSYLATKLFEMCARAIKNPSLVLYIVKEFLPKIKDIALCGDSEGVPTELEVELKRMLYGLDDNSKENRKNTNELKKLVDLALRQAY